MSRSILHQERSEAEMSRSRDDARLIDNFIDELRGINHRFYSFIDPVLGIRGMYQDRVALYCPLNQIFVARKGYQEAWLKPCSLEWLHEFFAGEMRMGSVSLRLADAVDNPFANRNVELSRLIMKAVGIDPQKAVDHQYRRWG